MKDFDELDNILTSLKSSSDNAEEASRTEPPVKSRAQRAAEEQVEPEQLAREKTEKNGSEQIDVQIESTPEPEPPMPSVTNAEKELIWFTPAETKTDKNGKDKPKKKKSGTDRKVLTKPDFSKLKAAFFQNLLPKVRSVLKKIRTKQLAVAAGILVLTATVAFGGVKLYEYSRVAYLKPYEKQYGIEYPAGILEEFCEQYGENQNTLGELIIEDTDTDVFASNQITEDYAYAFKGTDIYEQQQFRAVDVTGCADLERVYATADSFLNASQKITFNTLFEKAEYKVIAAYYTNKNPEDDSEYIFPYSIYGNLTENSFAHFADSIEHRRLYDTGFELTTDNTYLSLCADSDFMEDFKFVVLCVRVDGKKFEKSATAVPNEKIHYPQVWYDENGETNPYRFSGKWYPEIYTDVESGKTVKLTADDFDFEH